MRLRRIVCAPDPDSLSDQPLSFLSPKYFTALPTSCEASLADGDYPGVVPLAIYLATMSDFDYENNQTIVLNRSDEPIIAHSEFPKLSERFAAQGLAQGAGIVQGSDALVQELSNTLCDRFVQPLELADGRGRKLNRPGQGAWLPRPACRFALFPPGRGAGYAQLHMRLRDLRYGAGWPLERSTSWFVRCAVQAFPGASQETAEVELPALLLTSLYKYSSG